MRKLIIAAVVAAVVAAGIVASVLLTKGTEEKQKLYVYTWADYISPDVIKEFEEKNDCKVVVDTFEDNETMLAKMMVGSGGYDVVYPSSYIVPVMKRNSLIRELDMEKLPNVMKNFDEKYRKLLHEDAFKYSIPYAFSITGIAYRKDKIQDDKLERSWRDLVNPAFAKKACILRDMREVLGMGLKMTGKSVNDTNDADLDAACRKAYEIKQGVRCLDNEAYRSGIVSGDFLVVMGYNSDMLQIMDDNKEVPIEFFIPKEGTTCCWDEMVIPTESRNVELAYKFIDFLYDAEIAAENIETVWSTMPNKPMLDFLADELKSNPYLILSDELLKNAELIQDVGDDIVKFQKRWDVFLSGKFE